MATLKEITEMISRLPSGGVISDRNRYDQGYLNMTLGVFRARLLKIIYLKNNRINPVCYQKHWPQYEADLQDDKCCVKFRHPEVISLDNGSDGFRYAGSLSFANNYARIKSRGWLSTINDNAVMAANNNRRPTILYDGGLQILEVRGMPLLKELLTESLLADPLSIPTYNQDLDQYPINVDLLPDLMNMIFSEETAIDASKQIKPGEAPLMTNKRK